MSTATQVKFTQTSFGTTHDVTFDSTVTSGSAVVLLMISNETLSSVATTGESNTLSTIYSSTPTSGVLCRAWVHPNSSASVTGFRVTSSGGTQLGLFAVEFPGLDLTAPFDVGGDMNSNFTTTFGVTLATTTTNAAIAAMFATGSAPNSTNSGFTAANSNSRTRVYNSSELGAAGNYTPGGTVASATSIYGFAVAFKTASAATSQKSKLLMLGVG